MMKLASLALVLAACAPGVYSSSSFATGPAVEPAAPEAPAPDTRNAGQVIVDIMTEQGYTCTALETNWECVVPNSAWQLYVSYVPSEDGTSTTIWLDSWLERAFAKPCNDFAFAMQDLANSEGFFQASCDDGNKKFRLNTALNYASDLDVMGWVHDHENRRASAAQNLRSIHALSKDAVRVIAQR